MCVCMRVYVCGMNISDKCMCCVYVCMIYVYMCVAYVYIECVVLLHVCGMCGVCVVCVVCAWCVW